MPRVLLLTYEFAPFRGGVGRVAEGLAEGAVACGLEPIVLAPDYHADQSAGDASRPYLVQRFSGAFCSIVSPRRVLRFAALCRRAIRATAPDLVHGVDPPAQMALTALSRARLTGRYILTVHGTELLRYAAEPLPHLWMRNGFGRADAIACVSRHVLERLHRDFDVERARTFVSHPGIAPAWHHTPRADRTAVRAHYDIPDDAFVAITIARVVREKGQDRVLAALARAPEPLRRRAVYVVAGTGPDAYARELDEAAQATGIRLVRTGAVADDELIRLCDAADVFTMLSRHTPKRLEGLGLTYLESGARGLPSIACDTGGVAEAVLPDRTGLLLPAGAPADQVADAFARLADDAPLRDRLGAGARAHAARFTYEGHARQVYGAAGLL
ncbi:MAG TPA: glycosyltransferase family 4 protein [Albitalea sp.]